MSIFFLINFIIIIFYFFSEHISRRDRYKRSYLGLGNDNAHEES